ncbi:MurR/RpiR family transcriptional regulator [Bombilactobacillus folatiphilus]|uniref:MurR/RpiR family transcriptional regulator n=1 Tax=Bombilactobacillus folatiphilus TaxID=2923362 RepID=A0ABY4P8S3_9LACO|nr:MurR/RpiR family transcriptional regulator [Bombilactobacillus folatiphilus]UQS81974.1 MurR/RpiR family transcriptional regulator [Bombilactobacillus folatiphilus]
MTLFFKKIERHSGDLSTAEQQVFDYIKETAPSFLDQDIQEIAQKTFVSTATVSRTVKKLGYRSLSEFKFYLRLALEGDQPEQLTKANFLQHAKLVPLVSRADLDFAQLKRVTHLIDLAHHVEFLGLGPSYTVAVDGARRLIFAGKNASSRSEWDEVEQVVATIDPRDLVFLISCSGETAVMGHYATVLAQRQVNTVGIIGNPGSSIAQKVTEVFEVKIPNVYYRDLDLSTRIPLLRIIEIIIDEYIYQYKL